MSRVSRANKILDSVADKVGLSTAGKAWLLAATDPMHDERLELVGYPDREPGMSIVQCIKQSFTIVKPNTIPAGRAWSMHVVLDDDSLSAISFSGAAQDNAINAVPTASQYHTGGIGVVAYDANYVGPTYFADGANTFYIGGADISGQSQAKYRVLSQGFEVVNTTPPLYKSGAILVYEQPTIVSDPSTYIITSNSFPGNHGAAAYMLSNTPPADVATALLLAGSQQWDAADGCYCVSTMSSMDNPQSFPDWLGHLSVTDEIQYPGTSTSPLVWISDLAAGPNSTLIQRFRHHIIPYNRKGAFLYGLSDQSTFTINYNVIIETFPSEQSRTLIPLATPSPSEDPIALQLYSNIIQHMPVGVRFGDNDMGEWFLLIADQIANMIDNIARPVLSFTQSYRSVRKNDKAANARTNVNNTFLTKGKARTPQGAAPKASAAGPNAGKYKRPPAKPKEGGGNKGQKGK